jgi:hypothetical protein
MLPKSPTFGQRTALRRPVLARREPVADALSASSEAPDPVAVDAKANDESGEAPDVQPDVPPVPADPIAAQEAAARPPDARWAKRTPSRLGAQIVHESLSAPIACTVRDTSSTGARLEIVAQRGGNISRDRVPDVFTLFMPADRLEYDCQVMWRHGSMAGVRYVSPARRTARPPPTKRMEMPKKPHTSLIKLLIDPL